MDTSSLELPTSPASPRVALASPLLDVDPERLWVRVEGQHVSLSGLQLRLLVYLWKHRTWVKSRGQILEEVWGCGVDVNDKAVDVHVCRLRRRLGAAGLLLESVRSFGYRLNATRP